MLKSFVLNHKVAVRNLTKHFLKVTLSIYKMLSKVEKRRFWAEKRQGKEENKHYSREATKVQTENTTIIKAKLNLKTNQAFKPLLKGRVITFSSSESKN